MDIKAIFKEFILKGDYRAKSWHMGELQQDFETYMIMDFNAWYEAIGKDLEENKE
jgi:hypothetical protein